MSKRTAAYQLTAENFDDEGDQDDSDKANDGKAFSKAADDVMARRVIKKAKRRIDQTEAPSSNPFSILSSLKASNVPKLASSMEPSNASSENPFSQASAISFGKESADLSGASFLKKEDYQSGQSLNLFGKMAKQTESKTLFSNLSTGTMMPGLMKTNGSQKVDENIKQVSPQSSESGQMYAEQITALNVSVLSWIKKHIDENPLIDLTPVFADYTKHMNDIEKKYGKSVEETSKAVANNFNKGDNSPAKSMQSEATTCLPIITKANEVTAGKSTLVPTFLGNTQATFSVPEFKTNERENEDKEEAEDEDSEKDDQKIIIEEDSFYTTRCKLFFKKGTEWKELGVGMLYLKPLSEKIQLLVRMETAGGKVLLNISVSDSIPAGRVGKNNVSIVSVPNPPIFMKATDGDNTKPLNYLIRVKDSNEADNLLKYIKEGKK
ncbi:nuclear pore complex protein Nup50-like [Rhopilema esculentum]|uniref:nuclear pore complex protein Nup50-like n=1 Tax=Rhopilema esculentum TaxID=499914 RepID=UPI0031D51119|eukprot:gene11230-21417_t